MIKADKERKEAPLIAGITLAHFFAGIYHQGCTYWRKSKEEGGSEKNEEDEDEDEDEKKTQHSTAQQQQQQQQPPLVRREPIDIFADSPAAV
ncbi:hypothetical protein M0802_001021 [Mischocyttarus mexicanus]|nr:hypothetical protein M0802_001021 [Mischocyttarus mexicanus]